MENYTTAICRKPSQKCAEGLTTANLGRPDPELLLKQYTAYRNTLESLGLDIVELEPLDALPDSYFVEDVAVVTPEVAVICRPGAQARRDEPHFIDSVLEKYRPVEFIRPPGTVDGGDVLIIGNHCLIGLSERTSEQGANQMIEFLGRYGYRGETVAVPEALHFKSSVNFIDAETLLVAESCRSLPALEAYHHVAVPQGENYAANVVWINGSVLMPTGFAATRDALLGHGCEVIEQDVSEIEKMDGGLTCMSLRLN